MQRLCSSLHGILGSYLGDALQEGNNDIVACLSFMFLGLRHAVFFFPSCLVGSVGAHPYVMTPLTRFYITRVLTTILVWYMIIICRIHQKVTTLNIIAISWSISTTKEHDLIACSYMLPLDYLYAPQGDI
jgi:hypothetical protein